jgi:pyruvate dehydrogenase E1 component beta subunit
MERVRENLNRALDHVLRRDGRAYLLGQDIHDPYGGAFKVTAGLSQRYPDRVLAMPISESAMVGLATGLALAGDTAVVEIMFADFVALAFDQILNFASKSVTMYGERVPLRLVVRCPGGGGRGYGPTHSQSLQKHFIGIPNLALFEITPFHDNTALFDAMLARGEPCLLFEDKLLYGAAMWRGGAADDLFRFELLGPPPAVARVYPDDSTVDCTLIAPGGLVGRALDAMRLLLLDEDVACQLVVPAQLHPLDIESILPLLDSAGPVCVIEESTAGGTWGAEVAHRIHERVWRQLRGPVRLVHSADRVIPAAAHLERSVLVQPANIREAVREALND